MTSDDDDRQGKGPSPTTAGDAADNVVNVDFGRPRARTMEPGVAANETTPTKLAAFTEMIARGMVMVTLDSREAGVTVPPACADEPQLNLNFSTRFGVDDFAYDDVGVRASLSFGGRPGWCDVPWSSVWMLRSHVDGELAVFPSEVPAEVREQLLQAQAELEAAGRAEDSSALSEVPEDRPREPRGAIQLSSVPNPTDDDDDGDDDPPPRGGLRLVKG